MSEGRHRRRTVRLLARFVVLAPVLVWTACSSGRAGDAGPRISPTGIVYARGTPPSDTRYSQTAALYLRQERDERALELAREGVEADPGNPIHYFLAGVAHVRLGDYEEADRMFSEAERIYPAYELEVEPQRERAWAEAFNDGAEAYDRGDTEEAIRAWRRGALIYDRRSEVHRNLGDLLVAEGREDEAIEVYREGLRGLEAGPAARVPDEDARERRERARIEMEERLAQLYLRNERYADAEPLLRRQLERDPTDVEVRSDLAAALSGQGREEEAAELYGALLSESTLEANQLFNLGVALFRQGEPDRAATAFRRLTRIRPNSRDAWFNYANALFAAEDWERLAEIGDRLVEVDPLGENSWLITARARLESGDQEGAVRRLERADEVPVFVEDLQTGPTGGATLVQGAVVGNREEPGSPVRIRFTFYRDGESVGADTVTVTAPAEDERESFRLTYPEQTDSYRYEALP